MEEVYKALSNLVNTGQPGVLCTITSTQGSTPRQEGSKMIVYPDGKLVGTIGGGELERRVIEDSLQALDQGKPREVAYSMVDPNRGDPGVCGGQLRVFIDPILPKPKLIVIGCGHVGKEVVFIGHWLNFHVIACDDRPDLCGLESLLGADECYSDFSRLFDDFIEITAWTYVVMTTRDTRVDVSLLPEILNQKPAYVGVIGSHRRWSTTKSKLLDVGVKQGQIDLVHSPVGLNLGAETPKEIAISIMAEIIKVQNQGERKKNSGTN